MLMLATLNAALPPLLSGDQMSVDGAGVLRIKRAGVILFTVDLRPLSVPFTGVVLASQIKPNQIYWERVMPDSIVRTIKSVVKNADDSYDVTFTNDNGRHFNDLEQMSTITNYIDRDGALAEDMCIRAMVLGSPDGTNFQAYVGTKCSIDMLAAQQVTITLPPEV